MGYALSAVASRSRTKKADVVENVEVFDQIGLLVNRPPERHRVAL
jgi:hypothetical protein